MANDEHTQHDAGTTPDGDEYVIKNVVYQRYWCRHPNCTVSIPVVVREVD